MSKVVITKDFDFVPDIYGTIGYIVVYGDLDQNLPEWLGKSILYVFPLFYEKVLEHHLPSCLLSTDIYVEPEARFKVIENEKPRVENFYKLSFVYNCTLDPFVFYEKGITIWQDLKERKEEVVRMLDNEVEVRFYACACLCNNKIKAGEPAYSYLHNRKQRYYWKSYRGEKLFIIPEEDGKIQISTYVAVELGLYYSNSEVSTLGLSEEFEQVREQLIKGETELSKRIYPYMFVCG